MIAFRFAVISLLTVSMGISQVAASGSFQQGIPGTSTNRPDQPAPGAEPVKEQPPASLEGQIVNAITGEPIKRANILLFPQISLGPMHRPR